MKMPDTARVVSVVAGGWSFGLVDRSLVPGRVIAVNDACVHLARWDEAVSMDRLWSEDRFPHLRFHQRPTWLRKNAVQNLDVTGFDAWLTVFTCDNESFTFSDDPKVLNGPNSGVCALNRAYQLRPEVLFMFGFDMQRGPSGDPYWYPPYPWRPQGATSERTFRAWLRGFGDVARQFDKIGTIVYNVSSRTLVRSFPVVSEQELPTLLSSDLMRRRTA